jgi:MoaA/NifB/PqqE/SkfB family radical SAM enzyme
MVKPQVLGLLLTYRCTSICRMCCVDAGPDRKEEMRIEDAMMLIRQAAEIGIKTISLTGGEPFLCFEKMLKICQYASQLGLEVNVLTNCFWAKSEGTTTKKLRKLKNSGLGKITINADEFHQEFVPLDYVKRCFEVAQRMGLIIELRCIVAENTKRMKYFADKIGALEKEGLIMNEFPVTPIGRASELDPEILLYSPLMSPCPFVLRLMAVEPNGNLSVCCGVGGFSPPLIVGNIKKHSLKKLIKEADQNLLYTCLKIYGPQTLLGIMREKSYHPIVASKHVDRCHVCFDLLSNDKNQSMVQETLKLLKDELSLGKTLFELLDELPPIRT